MQTKRRMNPGRLLLAVVAMIMAAVLSNVCPGSALAASAREIDTQATKALTTLYKNYPRHQNFSRQGEGGAHFSEHCQGRFSSRRAVW